MLDLKRRIPSRNDLVAVFAVCVLVTFSWSILWFLYKLPSWLAFLSAWNTLGILAYGLVSSFLESALLLLLLVVSAVILPGGWLRDEFTIHGTLIVIVLTFWLGLVQRFSSLRLWSDGQIWLGLSLVLITIVLASILVRRLRPLGNVLRGLAGRATILLYVYVPLSILSLAIVVVRNVL